MTPTDAAAVMSADPHERHVVTAAAAGLPAALAARGLAGPVLVVADDATIAALAPAWAAAFAAAGVVHRVVVSGVDVAAAAAGLDARAVVAAGDAAAVAAARTAADILNAPLVEHVARPTDLAPSPPG